MDCPAMTARAAPAPRPSPRRARPSLLLFAPAAAIRTARRAGALRRRRAPPRQALRRAAPAAALHAPPPKLKHPGGDAGAALAGAAAAAEGATAESGAGGSAAAAEAEAAEAGLSGRWLAGVSGGVAVATAVFLAVDRSGALPGAAPGALSAALGQFVAGPHFLVSLGLGASAFIQALTGFGFAVVSVGALTQLDWIAHSSVFDTVQPVTATLGALTGWALLLPELPRVRWRAVRTLLVATTLGTPAGALLLQHADAALVLRGLGALITAYVAYAVAGVPVPRAAGGRAAAWVAGLVAGALGGAFDITGPPLVVHGEAAGWDSASGDFRRNVLAVVSVNSTLVVLWDLVSGRLDDFYYFDFLKYAAPSVVVCLVLGNYLSTKLNPAMFKKVVLATCAVLGLKLMFS